MSRPEDSRYRVWQAKVSEANDAIGAARDALARTTSPSRRRAIRCTGPDGTEFQNGSKAELARVLRRRYGKVVLEVVDGPTWRTRP